MSRRTPDDAPVQEATVSNSDSRPLGLSSVGNAGEVSKNRHALSVSVVGLEKGLAIPTVCHHAVRDEIVSPNTPIPTNLD